MELSDDQTHLLDGWVCLSRRCNFSKGNPVREIA